jgi:hypothetical protein
MNHIQRAMHYLLWLIRFDLVVAAAIALLFGDWELMFMGLLALILTFIPEVLTTKYKVSFPVEFNLLIVVFVYLSIFLGEAVNAYERFFWWDAMLHIASGVILSFAAFLILYILYREKKFQASPFIIAMLTFSFALALGTIWEIFEFGMDNVFGLNMQKNGLSDTMWDMIVNSIGALVVSYAGYRIIKNNRTDGLVFNALTSFFKENPKYRRNHWWKRNHASR